jgi:hypothetical protein
VLPIVPHGTFKFLFNGYYGTVQSANLAQAGKASK